MNYKHRKCKLGQIGLIKKSAITKDLKRVFFLIFSGIPWEDVARKLERC